MTTRNQRARQMKETLANKPSRTFILIRLALLVIMFISFIGWVYVDWNLGNRNLAWLAFFLGIGIAALISLLLERKIPEIAIRERKNKKDISLLILLICVNLLPPSLQYLNRAWSSSKSECKGYPVVSKESTYRRAYHYSFDVMIGPEKRQIDCEQDLYDQLTTGKDVEICTKKGGLGFDFITGIRP